MKTFSKNLALLTAFTFLTVGCSPVEEKSNEAHNNLVINNDPTELAQHITVKNEDVVVEEVTTSTNSGKPGIRKSNKLTSETTLTLLAEVDSPEYEGITLQATEVHINGNKAYVSYNVAGDQFLGAIDVIQVNKNKDPALLERIIFPDTDIHAIERLGNTLYLAAGTSDAAYSTSAVLKVVELSNAHSFDRSTPVTTIDLPSYAGTDVDVMGNYIYVSSGSTGGGISIFDKNTFNLVNTISVEDPRGISSWRGSGDNGVSIITGGTDAKLLFVGEDAPTEEQSSLDIDGAGIDQAKATVERNKAITLLGAGEGGMQVVCNTDNTLVANLAAPTGVEDSEGNVLDNEKTVTNAASASGRFVYMANGEAGVYMAKIDGKFNGNSCDMSGLEVVGKLQLGDTISANHVTAKNDLLFVASGLGGLKIIRIDDPSIEFTDEDVEAE